MKRIILISLIIPVFSIAQTKIIFKDGDSITSNRIEFLKNNMIAYELNDNVVQVNENKIYKVESLSLSTDRFEYNQLGLTNYVVIQVDSLNKDELFKRTENWIKETYKNPDIVIKAKIENDKIRFEGYQENALCLTTGFADSCYGCTYTIEVAFRDGRYKFTPISMTYRTPATRNSPSFQNDILFSSGEVFYNKKGIIRDFYRTFPSSIENLFNSLNMSLEQYLKSSKNNSVQDDW